MDASRRAAVQSRGRRGSTNYGYEPEGHNTARRCDEDIVARTLATRPPAELPARPRTLSVTRRFIIRGASHDLLTTPEKPRSWPDGCGAPARRRLGGEQPRTRLVARQVMRRIVVETSAGL